MFYKMFRSALNYIKMSEWRNWQTRTFEGRVGDRAGSSPASDTKKVSNDKGFGFGMRIADAAQK